ncbi:MAG: antitoxin [Acidimicrobiia bacterium]|nr:antitoxin [Acidimicrobiia bacterium]
MALNIKSQRVHEMVKRLAFITGESQAEAVGNAVSERLLRLEHEDKAARLLAIGRRAAARMSPELRSIDHDELLYDDAGLPK